MRISLIFSIFAPEIINKTIYYNMKHLILTTALFLAATFGYAQNISEPEYNGQVALINTDSTTTLLQKEVGEHKAKSSAFGMIPIPGASLLDKTKAYLSVKGVASPNKITSKKFSLIIRVKDNGEEPKNAFGIFKFETKKKERRFQLLDFGFGKASANTNFTTVDYNVKKFGTSSYLITLSDLEAGEYGVVVGDFSSIATFSVK